MIEAFKVGITLALVNQTSSVLGLVARDFAKTDAAAAKLERTMKNIRLMGLTGGMLAGAGHVGIKAIEGWYDAAKKYEQAFSRFKALNLGDSVNKDADKFAQSSRIVGNSATDLMTTMTDLHTVLGKFDDAKALTPFIAQMEFANRAVFNDGNKFTAKSAQDLAKVIELRGGFRSQEEMKTQADYMQHVMSGTGGRVGPTDYLNYIKTGGVAARLQSNDVFYYQMEPLIQEMGGNRIGTGLMSAYQNLAQGRTTLRAAKELQRLGLVDPGMVEYSTTGQLKQIKPGGVKGGDMVGSDPMQFLKTVLLPAFASHGITGDKAVINEIATVFSNRTAAGIYTTLYQQMEKVAKNIEIDRKAMGVKDLTDAAKKTPAGAEEQVAKAYEDLRIQFGLKVIPVLVPAMVKLADALSDLAGVAERHPTMTTAIVGLAGALAGLGTVTGDILLTVAALRGLKALGGVGGTAAAAAAPGATSVVGSVAKAVVPVALGAAAVEGASYLNGLLAPYEDKANAKGKDQLKGWWQSLTNTAEKPHFDALAPGSYADRSAAAIPASSTQTIQVNARVDLDGRRVGNMVSSHMAEIGRRPMGGVDGFDPTMHPLAIPSGN